MARQPNHTLRRKVLHTNVAALVAALSMLNLLGVAWQLGNATLWRVVQWQIPEMLLLLLIPALNRRGWDGAARWLLAVLLIASQLLAVYLGLGTYLFSHFYFILFALVPVAFFPMQQWKTIGWLSLFNLILFLWLDWQEVLPAADIAHLNWVTVKMLRLGYTVGILVTLLAFILLIELDAERNERKLELMTVTDALTHLPNRRFFELSFQRMLAESQDTHQPLALAMLDIDWFKKINDTLGHDVGDQVLRQVGRTLQECLRQGDVVSRVGGEEFAILLPNARLTQALEVGERIRQKVAASRYTNQALSITISVGVAEIDPHQPPSLGYKRADDALYAAKAGGRNQVVSASLAG